MNIKKLIREEVNNVIQSNNNSLFFHGTRTPLPFKNFDPKSDGTGVVSSGAGRYGGFFYTSNFANAEFYAEYFVATVQIGNIQPSPLTNVTHPPTVLKQAIQDKRIYQINEILDGASYSDIVVVPMSMINNVKIVKWDFVSDKQFYYRQLDEMFSYDEEEGLVTQENIKTFMSMIHEDVNYLLTIPIFKEYYLSKQEY